MNKRITITIDSGIEEALRQIQANKISSTNKSVSFSQIINQVLKDGLREFELNRYN